MGESALMTAFLTMLMKAQEDDPASLSKLHDIVAMPPVSWWPPAAGWIVLAVLLFLAGGWLAWKAFRRHRVHAYRRAALGELAAVDPSWLQTLQLNSRLTLVADAPASQYFLWHRLEKLALPGFAPGLWIQLSQLGGLVLEVSSVEAGYTIGEPTLLHVPAHDMTLRPRWAALAKLKETMAP